MTEPVVPSAHPLALRVVVAVLVAGALWVFLPLWPYLVLALWFAGLARPMHEWLAKRMFGRSWAAGVLTLLLFVVMVAPLVLVGVAVTADAIELWNRVSASESGQAALQAIVSPGGATADGPTAGEAELSFDLQSLVQIAQENGQRALAVLSSVAGVAATATLGLFIFLLSAYVFLVHGRRGYAWIAEHTPLAHTHQTRFAAAFAETGRGLAIGVGLTGISQGLIATIAYASLGVPRALVLGVITIFASVIPTIGTSLVWVPVSIGLLLSGETTKAIILGVVGVVVVSSVDNVLHPLFARWGKLDMHAFVVLIAMLGGIVAFGAWGLLLGPLIVRLAIEALRIFREEGMSADSGAQPVSSPETDSPSSSSSSSVRTESSTTPPSGVRTTSEPSEST